MKELLNRKLAAGLIAGSIALAGCAPSEQATPSVIKSFEAPSPTVIFSPSPSIDVTSSPAPSVEPTPESSNPTSTPDPIESVPITRYGDISTQPWGYPPYYTLEIDRAEIVAVEPPTGQNPNFEFAITVPTYSGKVEAKCTKQLLGIDGAKVVYIPSCNIQGVTIWSKVVEKTWFVGGNGGIGFNGAIANLDNFKVGSQLGDISIEFIKGKVDIITTPEANENKKVFNQMIADNGKKSFPRADKIFTFNVTQVAF